MRRFMSAPLEAFLARIYVDAEARARFLADPRAEAVSSGLSPTDVDAVMSIDRLGLEMTVGSLQRKREPKRADRR